MKFAGLDLSKVNLDFLSWKECLAMQQAFTENYEKAFGEIDYQPAAQIFSLLKRYIKVNFISLHMLRDEETSISDLRMAMAIYMFPTESNDPVIRQTNVVIAQLAARDEINAIRAQPFAVENVLKICELIGPEHDKLNLTGFWDKSADQLYNAVGGALLVAAYTKLNSLIKNKSNAPMDLALRYVLLFDLYQAIKKRQQGYDFKYGFDVIDQKRELDVFLEKIMRQMKNCIQTLRDMPDRHGERPLGFILHSFNSFAAKHFFNQDQSQKISKRVSPTI